MSNKLRITLKSNDIQNAYSYCRTILISMLNERTNDLYMNIFEV